MQCLAQLPHLHLLFQLLAERHIELLRIVLVEGVHCVPAKGIYHSFGGYARLPKLQLQA